MNPLLKLLVRFAIVFVVIFIAIQPFNWFCALTQKCEQFDFSNLIIRRERGLPFNFLFDVTSHSKNLSFEVINPTLSTVINRKNTITYHVKNLSKKTIYIRPQLNVDPKNFEQHLRIRNCLCNKVYKLKRGEETDLQLTFDLKQSIDDEDSAPLYQANGKVIKITFVIK